MKAAARLMTAASHEIVDLMGPTIEFLTPLDSGDGVPCIMRGTIPAGAVVPMHSHADVETFFVLSGEIEGLAEAADGFCWVAIKPGDVFHVPGGAKHGFRNRAPQDAVSIIVSTQRLGRFFREIGRPLGSGPPSPETIRHFLETAARYGYWNATPEENAQVGIQI